MGKRYPGLLQRPPLQSCSFAIHLCYLQNNIHSAIFSQVQVQHLLFSGPRRNILAFLVDSFHLSYQLIQLQYAQHIERISIGFFNKKKYKQTACELLVEKFVVEFVFERNLAIVDSTMHHHNIEIQTRQVALHYRYSLLLMQGNFAIGIDLLIFAFVGRGQKLMI